MKATITLLPGDGIGPEVVAQGRRVLEAIACQFNHEFILSEHLIGGAAMEASGEPLPEDSLTACRASKAVLLGAVGGPQWDDPDATVRPEQGLLALREALGLYANLRPVTPHPALHGACPLKSEYLQGVDLLVVRELTGGIYFGEKQQGPDWASDLCRYSEGEISRIVRRAARLARQRRGKLTLVDKANVLETSRLWRRTTQGLIASEFPDLELEILLVDAAAMHLLSRPADFDVIVTENLFGDILTDEASMLAGSLGLLPSASLGDGGLGDGGHGLYEPIHGSAPELAGRDAANPFATILSVALLLRWSLGLVEEADILERAVWRCLDSGHCTPDVGGNLGCKAATTAVLERLDAAVPMHGS